MSFATVAQTLRERGHDPHAVAHFVNRLVFCMFADDVSLLPGRQETEPRVLGDLAAQQRDELVRAGRVIEARVQIFEQAARDLPGPVEFVARPEGTPSRVLKKSMYWTISGSWQ